MTRRFRRLAASLAIVTLLLSQLIVAAHACAFAAAPSSSLNDPARYALRGSFALGSGPSRSPAMHAGCDGGAPSAPSAPSAPCESHCDVTGASVPSSAAPHVAAALAAPLIVPSRDDAIARLATARAAVTPAAIATAPPTVLLHSRLRI
jgi:hypothetical protein